MKTKIVYFLIGTFILFVIGCGSSFSSSKFKYVAIGASDAVGIGATPLTNGYVYLIADDLDAKCGDTELENLGIAGAEIDQIEDVVSPVAEVLNPELITIFVGGNDLVSGRSIDSFELELTDILTGLVNETSALIFIANLPDLSTLPRFVEEPDPNVTLERVLAYNEIIQRVGSANGAIVVDFFANGVDDILVSDDGFHPNDAGHRKAADLFLAQIVPALCPANSNQ